MSGDMTPNAQGRRLMWRGTGRTHAGLVRSDNQDAFVVLDQFGLWVIADGMGGHAGGEVASRLAVETLSAWGPRLVQPEASACQDRSLQENGPLREAIQAANVAIREQALTHPQLAGMGTTFVSLQIAAGSAAGPAACATVAHIGDSRAYLVRGNSLTQLTRDHTWVDGQVQQGLLTPQEASVHPWHHMLTKSLGSASVAEPDCSVHPLRADDWILLCTDGLTNMLEDRQILEVLSSSGASAERACDALIAEANRRGGQDNTTVLLVRADSGTA